MIRVVYISGKYRHWDEHGELDHTLMRAEIAQEQWWARQIALAGMAWIAPLSNSSFLDPVFGGEPGPITDKEFIERDLSIVRRQEEGFDVILMRPKGVMTGGTIDWAELPGWETSEGAKAELEQAKEVGLLVAQGTTEDIIEYLRQLGDDDETTLG